MKDAKFDQREDALSVLGYCQLAGKSYDAADATFAELLNKFPQGKRAESASIYRLQALYLNNKQADAARAAGEFIDRYSGSTEVPTALYFQALSEKSAGHDDRAVKALERLTRDYPESKYKVDGQLLLGQALESQGKTDKAIEQYRKMLANAPQARKADAHYSLGLALYKSGAYAESAKELSALVDQFPSSAYVKPAKLQWDLLAPCSRPINHPKRGAFCQPSRRMILNTHPKRRMDWRNAISRIRDLIRRAQR